MSAYAIGGLCYATPDDALTAFNNLYPIIGEVQMTYLASSTVTAAGALSYVVHTRTLNASQLIARSGTLYLTPCTTPDAPYDYANAGAIWAFFFSFTLLLWIVAKNAGLILNFVRRHT